jgi:predicted transposase YbfD/YdcC
MCHWARPTAPASLMFDLTGTVVTLDPLHTQAETARHLVEDKRAHYLMIVKGNQPGLLAAAAAALAGPARTSRPPPGPKRAPGTAPRAAQHPHSPRRRHRLAARRPGLPDPPRQRAHPRHLDPQGSCLRHHQPAPAAGRPPSPGRLCPAALEYRNREHYVRDKTFGEDLQHVRAGNQPDTHAAIRNPVIGAFRRAGYANIAHARRWHGRDEQRILPLYGYTWTDISADDT